ncbi:Major Facilitator Superfamily protein [Microbacterium sp. LKL04]|uniref:MFS transporter n=1 Tax=Microbacterium oleivorans TaxID=273677 RepID=A0A4R5YS10_9MICO|nr:MULTISPECIES: MFS transporter [Microbacterium]MDQ1125654.1 MFS family permease [Microbacterium sp. SORGH_AS_0505]TDL46137.1 MFS transporter [Microbacterium oleivorans]SCY51511.1 Major Facilitator Superfamily protein [Microbacterium sp. LKL04]
MPRQGAIVAVLAIAGLASSFMFTLVVPIQSKLPELLNASREDTAWVVTATLLAAAVSTPIAGRLGDMYGKRRIVLVLLGLLIVGSVIAALSPSIGGIIVGRALQGAVTGVVPLGISIMRDVLHEDRVDAAIALMSATLGVGGAVGMPVSAIITETSDWHVLFWMAAGLGAVVFVLVATVVPASVLRTAGRFDFAGAVGLAIGLTGVLLAVSRGNEWGWASPATLALGLGGLAVLLVWGWFELRIREPLLDLRVAARPAVLLTNLASVAMGFSLFASNVSYPQMLELPASVGGFGLTLVQASFIVMPAGLVMMVLSPFSGRLARTIGPRVLLIMGASALILAYGYSLLWASEVWHLLVANLLIGVGIGFGYAGMPMLIMRSVPQHETGASNGLNALFRSLGTSIAAAVVGAVLAALSVDRGGVAVPTPAAFQLSFALGLGAAVIALGVALFIPQRRDPHEARPSMPR